MAPKLSGRARERSDPNAMTLVQHLAELRRRILWSLGALCIAAVVGFVFYEPILGFLMRPYCANLPAGRHCDLLATNLMDGLNLRARVALYSGVAMASPVIMWNLWRFITPGLVEHEKRYALPFVAVSVVLFLAGAAVAYLVMHRALFFLQAVGGPHLHFFYTAPNYLRFVLALMAAFGVAFEFPVLLVGLELAGVLTPAQLASKRRWAIVGIFAAVALLIPSGDPVSLFAMAVPLVAFYEAAILIGRLAGR